MLTFVQIIAYLVLLLLVGRTLMIAMYSDYRFCKKLGQSICGLSFVTACYPFASLWLAAAQLVSASDSLNSIGHSAVDPTGVTHSGALHSRYQADHNELTSLRKLAVSVAQLQFYVDTLAVLVADCRKRSCDSKCHSARPRSRRRSSSNRRNRNSSCRGAQRRIHRRVCRFSVCVSSAIPVLLQC